MTIIRIKMSKRDVSLARTAMNNLLNETDDIIQARFLDMYLEALENA